MSKEKETMGAKLITATILAVIAAMMLAVSAQAAGPLTIESFSVGSSNTESGAHPDVTTSITMDNPGEPEAAQDVAINFPEGLFGNPQADRRLPICGLRAQPMPRCLAGRHHHDLRELRIRTRTTSSGPLRSTTWRPVGASRQPGSRSSRRPRTCR